MLVYSGYMHWLCMCTVCGMCELYVMMYMCCVYHVVCVHVIYVAYIMMLCVHLCVVHACGVGGIYVCSMLCA